MTMVTADLARRSITAGYPTAFYHDSEIFAASLIDDLVEEPLRIQLPAGPGLGVTLDQDKLRRYARR
jgi:L-alanine-DL-glutamate epimerase-like enolase superfamily enzyme